MGYDGAVDVQNDPSIEMGWLSEATTFAETYLASLLLHNQQQHQQQQGKGKDKNAHPPTTPTTSPFDGLPGTGTPQAHDTLYKAFRRVFPSLNITHLHPHDPLAPYIDREYWSPFLRRHGHLIADPTILTILRPDATKGHSAENAMLVPRLKFVVIEVARNREGVNGGLCVGVGGGGGEDGGGGEEKEEKLVVVKTRRFWVVGVVKEGRGDEEGEGGAGEGAMHSGSSSKKDKAHMCTNNSSGNSTTTGNHKPQTSSNITTSTTTTTTVAAAASKSNVDEVLAGLTASRGNNNNNNNDDDEDIRTLVEQELKRQLEAHNQAHLANRVGVAEQAREAVAPEVYKHMQEGEPRRVLGQNAVCELWAKGLVVVDNVLSPTLLAAARQEAALMKERGQLKMTPQKDAGTRFDAIRWLNEKEMVVAEGGGEEEEGCERAVEDQGYSTLAKLVEMMKGLAWEIEEGKAKETASMMPPLAVPKHCMLACYEGMGACYVAHRDNIPRSLLVGSRRSSQQQEENGDGNDREVTAILYLNESDYDAQERGGALRCFVGAEPTDDAGETALLSEIREIEPKGGRLVLFQSRELLHEVCPVLKEDVMRWALSIWILGRGKGKEGWE